MPSRCCTARISSRIRPRRPLSRLLNGSSSSSTFGSRTSARASATRCCCPPERAGAGRSAKSARPTMSSACIAVSRAMAFFGRGRVTRSGNMTLSITVMCGQIAYDWNTMPIGRRCAPTKMPRAGSETTWPSISMIPCVGSLEAGDQPQRRGLAATARSEQGDQLAVGNVQIDAVDGVGGDRSAGVALGQSGQLDHQLNSFRMMGAGRQRGRRQRVGGDRRAGGGPGVIHSGSRPAG